MIPARALAAGLALALLACGCRAEMLSKSGRFANTEVEYKVLLPPRYDQAKAYPLVLVFTGGAQGIEAAQNTVEQDWQAEAQTRGYIVVSPAAPDGELFFQEGDRVFPTFLDTIRRDYKVAGKIHIAGHSNGGLSAFHIAAKYPSYFSTVTGYPGLYQDNPEADWPAGLKGLCLFMHVGDHDDGWRPAMQEEAKQLKAMGWRIQITVEPNQVHRLKAGEIDLSRRLFDEIESCR